MPVFKEVQGTFTNTPIGLEMQRYCQDSSCNWWRPCISLSLSLSLFLSLSLSLSLSALVKGKFYPYPLPYEETEADGA
jgi:hypothetical protein